MLSAVESQSEEFVVCMLLLHVIECALIRIQRTFNGTVKPPTLAASTAAPSAARGEEVLDVGERRESSAAAWFERSWASVTTQIGLGETEDGVDDVARPLEEEEEDEEDPDPVATVVGSTVASPSSAESSTSAGVPIWRPERAALKLAEMVILPARRRARNSSPSRHICSSINSRKCCCGPMMLPGRQVRIHAMASAAVNL